MDILPSKAVQKITVSANLNSTLLLLFLMGIYSGVCGGTLYIYSGVQNPRGRCPIATVFSVLYIAILGQVCIQWYYFIFSFVAEGDTRLSIFETSSDNSFPSCLILSDVLWIISLLLADGLLIWRCFHACAGSWYRIVPLFLFGFEFATCVADATFYALLISRPSIVTESRLRTLGIIDGSAQGLAIVTSVVATSIIGWSIWASINHHEASNRRHRNLIDIFIQTSVLYCLSLIGNTTCDFLLFALKNQRASYIVYAVGQYPSSLNLIITGLAPTLMVARLTKKMEEQKEAFSSHDTGHQFVSYPEGHPTTNSDGILGPEITAGQDESTRIAEASEVV